MQSQRPVDPLRGAPVARTGLAARAAARLRLPCAPSACVCCGSILRPGPGPERLFRAHRRQPGRLRRKPLDGLATGRAAPVGGADDADGRHHPRAAQCVGRAQLRALDLTITRNAGHLVGELGDHPHPGGADRVATRLQAAGEVDRNVPAARRGAALEQRPPRVRGRIPHPNGRRRRSRSSMASPSSVRPTASAHRPTARSTSRNGASAAAW